MKKTIKLTKREMQLIIEALDLFYENNKYYGATRSIRSCILYLTPIMILKNKMRGIVNTNWKI